VTKGILYNDCRATSAVSTGVISMADKIVWQVDALPIARVSFCGKHYVYVMSAEE